MLSEWGWNPGTFEAIGTVVAALFGVFGFLVAVRQYALSVKSQRQTNSEVWRRHAESLTVEIVRDSRKIPMYSDVNFDKKSARLLRLQECTEAMALESERTLVLHIVNRSDTHVKLLGVVSGHRDLVDRSSRHVYYERKWLFASCFYLDYFWNGTLPPGDCFVNLPLRENVMHAENALGILFKDDAGKLWTRRLDGTLFPGTFGKNVPDLGR